MVLIRRCSLELVEVFQSWLVVWLLPVAILPQAHPSAQCWMSVDVFSSKEQLCSLLISKCSGQYKLLVASFVIAGQSL